MSNSDPKYTGHCLCGAVIYEITGELDDPHSCHCGQCRRQSGHFVVGAGVKRSELTITGEDNVVWYRSSSFARRGFCGTCGSVMLWDDDTGRIGINLGSLNQPTNLKLVRHIFVEDKADYYEIEDDLPQFIGSDKPAPK